MKDEERVQVEIKNLVDNLELLRAKASLSQGELAEAVGLSRQTYSCIITGRRKLCWTNYLAFIFYFSQNKKTAMLLKNLNCYPQGYVREINRA